MIFRNWVLLAASVIIGLIALTFAAHAADTTAYDLGLLVFALAVAAIFYLVKRVFDQANPGSH